MRQKIRLYFAIIALLAVLATTAGITFTYYNLLRNQVREDLKVNARLLSDTEIFQKIHEDAKGEEKEENIASLKKLESDNLRITWIDEDGKVLYDNDYPVNKMKNHLNRPEIQAAIKQGWGESVRKSDTMQWNTYYYALQLEDGTILRVSTQASSISNVFLNSAPVILLIAILILLVCVFLGYLLTHQLLRPINMMAEHLDDNMDPTIYKELQPFAQKLRSQHDNILAAATSRQDFTANVSHELKTPLTAISGYAELLENGMIDESQQEHVAQAIRSNSDRLLALINDIIKLSELDHTELPRQFVQLDLYEIVSECCKRLEVSARKKQITLNCFGRHTMMTGDRDLLKELIENLVQNAIRYNNEEGKVRVIVFMQNSHPVLLVEDNGIGIPVDQQERVFERFYRVDKSRSRETGGTGLGLAIVKHIAEIHNAQIVMDSEVGKGTKISVLF